MRGDTLDRDEYLTRLRKIESDDSERDAKLTGGMGGSVRRS